MLHCVRILKFFVARYFRYLSSFTPLKKNLRSVNRFPKIEKEEKRVKSLSGMRKKLHSVKNSSPNPLRFFVGLFTLTPPGEGVRALCFDSGMGKEGKLLNPHFPKTRFLLWAFWKPFLGPHELTIRESERVEDSSVL